MQRTIPMLILLAALFAAFTQPALSQDKGKKDKKETVTKQKPFNTICPVMGEEVETGTKTVTYNGKVYGFCCKKCIGKFEKNPEKYSKNLSEDGKKYVGK